MKTETIKVGELEVVVTLSKMPSEHAIEFIATCGGVTKKNRMTLPANHQYTAAQLAIDVTAHVKKLAEECVGHAQVARIVDDLLKET